MARFKALLFDLGDTIMQEVSEVKDQDQTTQHADLFPGMAALIRTLHQRGYLLGLVADTRPGTYRNVLRAHRLYDHFTAFAISEELGCRKPHPAMFLHALAALGLAEADAGSVAMIGNNLARDIKGANALGLVSILLCWNERYPTSSADPCERPHHCVRSANELLALVEAYEQGS